MNSEKKYTKENFSKAFSLLGWTVKEIFRISFWDTILVIFLSILFAMAPIINAFLGAKVLDEVIKLIGRSDLTLTQIISFDQTYFKLLVVATVVSLIAFVIRRSLRYLKTKFRIVHLRRQQEELNAHISNLDPERFEDNETSNAILRANDNLWKVRDFLEVAIDFITELTSMIASSIIIFQYSWVLGIYLIVSSIPSGYVTLIFIKKFYDFYNLNTETFRKRGWIYHMLTSEHSIKQNKISGANKILHNTVTKITSDLNDKEMSFRYSEYKNTLAVSLLDKFNAVIVPLAFIPNLLLAKFSIGDFTFFTGRALDIPNRLEELVALLSSMFDDLLGIEHVKKVFDIENRIKSGQIKITSETPPTIEFQNVSFKYPKSNKYAIKNLNITINSKDEIAIVGENGAGKSTFIKLILRLYDPTEGAILINGIDIRELNLEGYYQVVGVLFQDYSLYGTLNIEENIAIGAIKKFSEFEVIKAAKNAEANKFISELPKKYKTPISKSFEGGVNLSTGQEQKIALARMFYRDSPILILDEPTASIDPVAEYKIFKEIYEFMTEKTVIIISHRFSTVRNAQKIYVFDKGKIIEQGSHKELMKLNGVYADAFNKQAEGYTKED